MSEECRIEFLNERKAILPGFCARSTPETPAVSAKVADEMICYQPLSKNYRFLTLALRLQSRRLKLPTASLSGRSDDEANTKI
jgi:hypothetical protein